MKRLLSLLVFLLLIVLILFFWQKQVSKNGTDDVYNVTNIGNTTEEISESNKDVTVSKNKRIKFKPQKRQVVVPIEKMDLEIEVKSDENGVVITKIDGKPVEKRVSSAPVQRLSVKNGIMTFWEINEKTQKLKYRSINLGAYVNRIN